MKGISQEESCKGLRCHHPSNDAQATLDLVVHIFGEGVVVHYDDSLIIAAEHCLVGANITGRQYMVVKKWFRGHSTKCIGGDLHMTEAEVRETFSSAIRRLRHPANSSLLVGYVKGIWD